MTKRSFSLQRIGLSLFVLGPGMAFLFSALFPGEELWKQVVRWVFVAIGFLGFGCYVVAILRRYRSDG